MKNHSLQHMRRYGALLAVLPLTFLNHSCSELDCPADNTVVCTYLLMNPNGTVGALNSDTLTITSRDGVKNDTIILLNQETGSDINGFDLPLSHTQPEDVLYTELHDTLHNVYLDTIRIKKDNHPHFESVDCQATYFHTLTAVSTTHHAIDSIVIIKADVTYDKQNEHLHLYLKADR